MDSFFEKHKWLVIGGTVAVVLIIGGVIFAFSGNSASEEEATAQEDETANEPIPTVDPSVEVTLDSINDGEDVQITVDNVPSGTEEIEVEISYERNEPELDQPINDGSFDVMRPDGNTAETEIKLGTCSSGVCRYHDLTTGEIRTVLLFSGEYGEQIYENTFEIEI